MNITVAFIDGVKSKFDIVFSILAIAENIRADVYEEFAYER